MGSFGGYYFRPMKSGVLNENIKDDYKEFPKDWFEGLKADQYKSSTYNKSVNKFGVKCGSGLEDWESSGWITAYDPRGWFQWYCRFYLGRRCDDDDRQVDRWSRCAGDKGRWKMNLVGKVMRKEAAFDDADVSPVVRQTLQHWAYELKEADYNKAAKGVSSGKRGVPYMRKEDAPQAKKKKKKNT